MISVFRECAIFKYSTQYSKSFQDPLLLKSGMACSLKTLCQVFQPLRKSFKTFFNILPKTESRKQNIPECLKKIEKFGIIVPYPYHSVERVKGGLRGIKSEVLIDGCINYNNLIENNILNKSFDRCLFKKQSEFQNENIKQLQTKSSSR